MTSNNLEVLSIRSINQAVEKVFTVISDCILKLVEKVFTVISDCILVCILIFAFPFFFVKWLIFETFVFYHWKCFLVVFSHEKH